jgi:hypothetical protein
MLMEMLRAAELWKAIPSMMGPGLHLARGSWNLALVARLLAPPPVPPSPRMVQMPLARDHTTIAPVPTPFALRQIPHPSAQTMQTRVPIPFAPETQDLRIGAESLRTCADSLRIRVDTPLHQICLPSNRI